MMGEPSVLVITPSPYMTKKIQQTLIDIGGYKVITSSSPAVALELAQQSIINICILDVFHPEFPVLTVVKELMKKQPGMQLILVLSDTNQSYGEIPGIIPDGLLPRSFSSGQLKSALVNISQFYKTITPPSQQPTPSSSDQPREPSPENSSLQNIPPLSGSTDFSRVNQHLVELSAETTALAIIILRRKMLIAHSGIFPFTAIQEITDQINSLSNTSAQNLQKEATPGHQKIGSGDMVRFIQLQSIQGKFLQYIISLTKEMQLALIYDHDTPFSNIRRQTVHLAHELIQPQQNPPLEYRPSSLEDSGLKRPTPIQSSRTETIYEIPVSQSTAQVSEVQTDKVPNMYEGPSLKEVTPPGYAGDQIDAILSSPTGSPDRAVQDARIEFIQAEMAKKIAEQDSFELEEEDTGEPLDFSQTESDKVKLSEKESETNSITSAGSYGHYITYSCLLIPRMPEHMLKSNLASYLFKWMGQLCLAYGWRLEHLSIHPNHIQMVTGAPLTTSPAFLVRTLRQKTSQYIFSKFPPLTNEKSFGRFLGTWLFHLRW